MSEAIADHLPRQRSEVKGARPSHIVTVGSAAPHVFAALVGDRPKITNLAVSDSARRGW